MCQSVAITVFHIKKNVCHHLWKTLRTTLLCFIVLQSRQEGLKSRENYETDLSHSFSLFNDLLPRIGDQQCIALYCIVMYILCVENCQNHILTDSCLPIAERLFYNVGNSCIQDLRVQHRSNKLRKALKNCLHVTH